ncbi:hypothetical protein [Saccharopolyspora elongata]|uniref:hypothetical protein n=1 Tax=Saccharopolyspora elongata TaxID=2530387 RepID=UPI001A9E7878|nr:hypothetical protein [Saccharopolyspora elongata]
MLRTEYDNVLAALRHLCDTGDAGGAIGLAVNLTWYWQMLGRHPEAAYWLGEAVAVPAQRPSVEHDIAEGVLLLNTIATQGSLVDDSIEERRALTDRLLSYPELPGFGGALTAVGLACLEEIEASPSISRRLVDGPEMIAAARERALRSATPEMAMLLDAREAGLQMRLGDLDRARELIESAEAELSEQPPFAFDGGQALVGAVRGALCLELGDGPGAQETLGRAYAAAVDSKDMPIVATVAVTVAGLAALYGQNHDLAVILGAAARLRGAHDHTDPQVRTLTSRGRAALGDERFAEAYETGWQLDAPAALPRTDPARLRRAALPAADTVNHLI